MEESGKIFAPATFFGNLAAATAYPFSDWPNPEVPTFAAGVYTIWHRDGRFIYVGMSGRGMTADTVDRKKPQGIYTRLKSHATGRRSGDQFCVYVADRFVLPSLSATGRSGEVAALVISLRSHSQSPITSHPFDALTLAQGRPLTFHFSPFTNPPPSHFSRPRCGPAVRFQDLFLAFLKASILVDLRYRPPLELRATSRT